MPKTSSRDTAFALLFALTACGEAPPPQAPTAQPPPSSAPTITPFTVTMPPPAPRSPLETYATAVTLQNQRPIGGSAVDFARYLNAIHNRLHPIFIATLVSLDKLPADSPLNDKSVVTRLEIVVSPDGRVLKRGVVKTSGQAAMDNLALDTVDRAGPFGPLPASISSTDGNVYVEWEFHRDEVFSCSTINVRPFRLDLTASP